MQAAQGNGALLNGVHAGSDDRAAGTAGVATPGGAVDGPSPGSGKADAKGGGHDSGSGPLEALVSQVEAAVEHGVNAEDGQARLLFRNRRFPNHKHWPRLELGASGGVGVAGGAAVEHGADAQMGAFVGFKV